MRLTRAAVALAAVLTLSGRTEAGPPQIRFDSISPASGPQSGGTAVTIKGDRLRGTTSVTVGGVALGNLVVIGDDTIQGVTSASKVAGAVDVVITGKKRTHTEKGAFTYGTPQPATQVALLSGDKQTGPAGTTLPNPLVVVVKDAGGNPVSGFSVTFAVTAGGGSLSATTIATNAQGQASTSLKLGATAGTNTVTATATGLTGSPVTFTETGAAAGSASLAKLSGDAQTGVAGSALANPLVVVAKDSAGNPVAGAMIAFAVASGGGSLSASSVATNGSGQATTLLTLGKTAGPNSVTATATGLPAVTFTATGTAGPASQIALVSGNNQTGQAGQPLASPFVVAVRDANGNTVSGVSVTFAVTAGAGTLSATAVATNGQGQASSTLTLGPTANATNMATASGTGLGGSPVTFTATSLAATPSFATDVKPVLDAKCTLCHTQGGPASFTPFTDAANGPAVYARVRNGVSFFQAGTPLVIPGDLTSILVTKTSAAGTMYVNCGANDTERAANAKKISDWVKAGAAP